MHGFLRMTNRLLNQSGEEQSMTREFVLPPSLEKGDKVAIARPGNGPGKTEFPEVYELGLERLRNVFGLKPVELPTCDRDMEYLSEHPEERAQDVMDAFKDPDIKGVVAVTGGAGEQLRILKHLDPEVLRKNPTRFYGISDNTSLALYLWNQGIVSFYGGQLMNDLAMQGEMHDYTVNYLKKAFFSDSIGEIESADRFTDETLDWNDPENLEKRREMEENPGWIWHDGSEAVIEDRTWGGCFEILVEQFIADKYIPDSGELEGKILVLETSEEVPEHYWADWFFMALGERGLLEKFSAVLVGRPKARHHEDPGKEPRRQYREKQRETIRNRIDEYATETPVVFNVDFGHTDPIVPVPIGGKVRIDAGEQRIDFY